MSSAMKTATNNEGKKVNVVSIVSNVNIDHFCRIQLNEQSCNYVIKKINVIAFV
jgi:hypothetical protein